MPNTLLPLQMKQEHFEPESAHFEEEVLSERKEYVTNQSENHGEILTQMQTLVPEMQPQPSFPSIQTMNEFSNSRNQNINMEFQSVVCIEIQSAKTIPQQEEELEEKELEE